MQSIVVPTVRYHCEAWDMHSLSTGLANEARAQLQSLYERYLQLLCGRSLLHLVPCCLLISWGVAHELGKLAFLGAVLVA